MSSSAAVMRNAGSASFISIRSLDRWRSPVLRELKPDRQI